MENMLHSPWFGVGVLFLIMAIDLFIRCIGSSIPKDKKKK